MGLGTKILIGMIVGLVLGLLLNAYMDSNKELAASILAVVQTAGDLFMRMLRMGVVPLIFFNIVYGITQMDDAASFGKVGVKLLTYYVATMLVGTAFGILAGFIVNPGVGVTIPLGATPPKPATPPTVASAVLDFLPVISSGPGIRGAWQGWAEAERKGQKQDIGGPKRECAVGTGAANGHEDLVSRVKNF
jgi:Na+/H+-dicarboxylate symporter